MADIDTPNGAEEDCDKLRREALRKLGIYGAATGVGLLGLMTATKAPAASTGCQDIGLATFQRACQGWGN